MALVPHAHLDTGWLKTVDQCYLGANTTVQHASVKYIADAVVGALLLDPAHEKCKARVLRADAMIASRGEEVRSTPADAYREKYPGRSDDVEALRRDLEATM